jgi:dienelactone hydrolase
VKEKREQLYQLLGDLPPRDRPVSAETLYMEKQNNYLLEKLSLDLNGAEPVPAYFVKPAAEGKYPVVLFCHSHGGKYHLGKDELIHGNTYMYVPAYADALTAAGYAVLCIDSQIFGERSGRAELDYFKELIWHGKVLWGLMVYDHLRAIDYLHTRADVDAQRLAVLGMSMGSNMSWWLAALDERVKVCADICCMTDYHSLIEKDGLSGHGIYYFVPSLLKYFDTAAINSLIAPRPHLSVNGTLDSLTPEEGLDKVDKALQAVYREKSAEGAWQMKKYPVQHIETAEMRRDVLEFLEKWL